MFGVGQQLHFIRFPNGQIEATMCFNKSEATFKRLMAQTLKEGRKQAFFCSSVNRLHKKYEAFLKEFGKLTDPEKYAFYSTKSEAKFSNANVEWKNKQFVAYTSKLLVGVSYDCEKDFMDVFVYAAADSLVLVRDVFQAMFRVREIQGHVYVFMKPTPPHNTNEKTPMTLRSISRHISEGLAHKEHVLKYFGINLDYYDKSNDSLHSRLLMYNMQERALNNFAYSELFDYFLRRCQFEVITCDEPTEVEQCDELKEVSDKAVLAYGSDEIIPFHEVATLNRSEASMLMNQSALNITLTIAQRLEIEKFLLLRLIDNDKLITLPTETIQSIWEHW